MPSLRSPDIRLGPYPEKTTRVFTATIKDENAAAIAGSALTTAVYTLYDEDTVTTVAGTGIINSRQGTNCKPNVSEAGVLTLELLPADMVMVTGKIEESHRLLIEWTYSAGARRGSYEAQIIVQEVEKVD